MREKDRSNKYLVRDVIMINTRIRKLLNLVLLGSVLLIFTNEKVNRCIDDAVLLENRILDIMNIYRIQIFTM